MKDRTVFVIIISTVLFILLVLVFGATISNLNDEIEYSNEEILLLEAENVELREAFEIERTCLTTYGIAAVNTYIEVASMYLVELVSMTSEEFNEWKDTIYFTWSSAGILTIEKIVDGRLVDSAEISTKAIFNTDHCTRGE